MGCVWRVSCFLAATENPYGEGGTHTLLPHPHPLPFTILCWKDEEGQTNSGMHGVMQGHDLPVISLEESGLSLRQSVKLEHNDVPRIKKDIG